MHRSINQSWIISRFSSFKFYPSVIKLSDNDARIIKETFKTASKFNDFKTLIKLRSKILEVTDIKSVHKSDKEFIDVILKDYNFYTQNM